MIKNRNPSNLDPNSFDQAYAVLKRNADILSHPQEPSIDQLLPLVEESLQAYQICKTRLAAIQQALAPHLEPESGTPALTPAPLETEETRSLRPL